MDFLIWTLLGLKQYIYGQLDNNKLKVSDLNHSWLFNIFCKELKCGNIVESNITQSVAPVHAGRLPYMPTSYNCNHKIRTQPVTLELIVLSLFQNKSAPLFKITSS